MYDPDLEEYRRDEELARIYKDYEVKVTVVFTYKTSAKNEDEAESDAYDDIKNALRGSYLDYDFKDFNSKEVE